MIHYFAFNDVIRTSPISPPFSSSISNGFSLETKLVTIMPRKEKMDRVMKNQRNILGSSSRDMINLFIMPRVAYENESDNPKKTKS